jgi:hypothetical protein
MKAYEEHALMCPRLKDARADCICFQKAPPYQPPVATQLGRIESLLAAIEQGQARLEQRIEAVAIGQNVLCEQLDAFKQDWSDQAGFEDNREQRMLKALDEIRGALLEQQFSGPDIRADLSVLLERSQPKGATKPCRAKKQKRQK